MTSCIRCGATIIPKERGCPPKYCSECKVIANRENAKLGEAKKKIKRAIARSAYSKVVTCVRCGTQIVIYSPKSIKYCDPCREQVKREANAEKSKKHNSVRFYRNIIKAYSEIKPLTMKVCKECGKDVLATSAVRGICPACYTAKKPAKQHNPIRRDCAFCGREFINYSGGDIYCSMECRELDSMIEQRQEIAAKNLDEHYRRSRYEVVFDPDKDGGFRECARFDETEYAEMYKLRHFTPGTVLRDLAKDKEIVITYEKG